MHRRREPGRVPLFDWLPALVAGLAATAFLISARVDRGDASAMASHLGTLRLLTVAPYLMFSGAAVLGRGQRWPLVLGWVLAVESMALAVAIRAGIPDPFRSLGFFWLPGLQTAQVLLIGVAFGGCGPRVRYALVCAAAGCGWALAAAVLPSPDRGGLFAGMLAAPLIGVIIGWLSLPAYRWSAVARCFTALLTMYVGVALFGMAVGLGRSSPSWAGAAPAMLSGAAWCVGAISIWGLFAVALWALAVVSHEVVGACRPGATTPLPRLGPPAPRPSGRRDAAPTQSPWWSPDEARDEAPGDAADETPAKTPGDDRGGTREDAHAPPSGDAHDTTRAPPPARRLPPGPLSTWTVLLLTACGGSLVYNVLHDQGLQASTALFVGLPLTLGLMVAHLTRTRTAYGRVLQSNLLFLAVVAPLLGEGSICVLMAAPLFLGVSMTVTALAVETRAWRRARRAPRSLVVLLPFALGVLETHGDVLAPPIESVRTETLVQGSAALWRSRVREVAPVVAHDSALLGLGFPVPTGYSRDGDRVLIPFTEVEGIEGAWTLTRVGTDAGVRFELQRDDSKIGRWLQLLDSSIDVEPGPDGHARLVHTTRFRSLLSPRWYFVPVMRAVLEEAHALAANCWSAAAPPDAARPLPAPTPHTTDP